MTKGVQMAATKTAAKKATAAKRSRRADPPAFDTSEVDLGNEPIEADPRGETPNPQAAFVAAPGETVGPVVGPGVIVTPPPPLVNEVVDGATEDETIPEAPPLADVISNIIPVIAAFPDITSGVKTSEFWKAMIPQVLAVIVIINPKWASTLGPNQQGWVDAAALLMSALASVGYSMARSRVKVKALQTQAVITAAAMAPADATGTTTLARALALDSI